MVEEIPARTGKMGHFYLGFNTHNFCRAVNYMRLTARCFGRLNMTYRVGHPHPNKKIGKIDFSYVLNAQKQRNRTLAQ